MTHIIRKPLIPCVLLVLLIFDVCFLTLFQQNILDDQASVEEMYQSVQLTFQVLAGDDGELRLKGKTARKILLVEGISDYFYYYECPYSMREPYRIPNCSTVYGVSGLTFFSEERGVQITYGDGWDEKSVLTVSQGAPIPCILELNMANILEVEAGDTFVIAPNAGQDTDPPSAPSLIMVVAGTFADEAGLVDPHSVIVCPATFFTHPGFLYDETMALFFSNYRALHVQIDPPYNRDFQRIKDEINAILKGDGDFILYSNVRILEQAVRPIEQKIHIQQMLVTPLSILLCVASAVVAVLLCTGFSTEVFLRLFLGEKRPVVWLSMTGSLIVLMAAEGAMALLAVWLVSGTGWIAWAARYLLLTVCLCAAAAAVQQAVFCGKNLVAFYQSKED